MDSKVFIILFCLATLCNSILTQSAETKPEWAKKDIRDYSDADLERLYEQWEEHDDEPLPEDELPESLRKPPAIDMSQLDFSNPENAMKMSKKGRTVMLFVSVLGPVDRSRTEEITTIWQSSLQNNHMNAQRFIVQDDRAIFMFTDGAQAWDAKNFLIEQQDCKEVSLENQVYPGKYAKAHSEL